MLDKRALRREIAAQKRALSPAQIEAASADLTAQLLAHPLFRAARSLYAYLSYNQEVRTLPLIRQAQALGKRVAVGPAASATENATLAAFDAMGIDSSNTSLENLGLGDGADSVGDGILDAAFGFGVKEGNSSNFAGSGVEVMKSPYLGKNGHIAVKTNSIPRAAAELAKNGFTLDESTAKYKGEKMVAVYLKQEFGGFAVHLLQK